MNFDFLRLLIVNSPITSCAIAFGLGILFVRVSAPKPIRRGVGAIRR